MDQYEFEQIESKQEETQQKKSQVTDTFLEPISVIFLKAFCSP